MAKLDEFLNENPEDRPGELTAMKAVILAASGDQSGAELHLQSAAAKEKEIGFGEFHHTAYLIACGCALLNQTSEALRWLRKTVEKGFSCYPLFERDPNLSQLRNDAGFIAFLGEEKREWERRKVLWQRLEESLRATQSSRPERP
ncbi:MAG: hypothetical protein HYY23_02650 [Verrucomicrobia bacterium]|nr:hypothetical protein [Verrucomicrobiota bacterium]